MDRRTHLSVNLDEGGLEDKLAKEAAAGVTAVRIRVTADRSSEPTPNPMLARLELHRFSEVTLDVGGDPPQSPEFRPALSELGVQRVALTLHSADARVHDALERSAGAHGRVREMIASPDLFKQVRVPVWSARVQPLDRLFGVLQSARSVSVELMLPRRLPEGASGAIARTPAGSELQARIEDARARAAHAGIPLTCPPHSGIPRCLVPDLATPDRGADPGSTFAETCSECPIREACPGARAWYIEHYGDDAVNPTAFEAAQRHAVDWEAADAAWRSCETAEHAASLAYAARALGFAETEAFEAGDELPEMEDCPAERIGAALQRQGCERVEEVAFSHGLKPVLYLEVPFEEIAHARRRWEEYSLSIIDPRESAVAPGIDTSVAHLFAGHQATHVNQAAAVYRNGDPTLEAVKMGQLMGYPRCCVNAFFCQRGSGRDADNVVQVARRSTSVGHPLLHWGIVRLTPFYPCRFDCPEAIDFAGAALDVLVDPMERVELIESLACSSIYFDERWTIVFDAVGRDNAVSFQCASVHRRAGRTKLRAPHHVLGSVLAHADGLEVSPQRWTTRSEGAVRHWARELGGPGVLLHFDLPTRHERR